MLFQSGGLFGAKPAGFSTGFFGQPAATQNTGFAFGATQPQQQPSTLSGGLFGNKPATSTTGFGTNFGGVGTSTAFTGNIGFLMN